MLRKEAAEEYAKALKEGLREYKECTHQGIPGNPLVLDEILGLVDLQIISFEEFKQLLDSRPEEMSIICTGRVLDDRIRDLADEIYNILPEK